MEPVHVGQSKARKGGRKGGGGGGRSRQKGKEQCSKKTGSEEKGPIQSVYW